MAELHTGDRAPAFQAWDQVKNSVKLGDFEGRRLFVFFYPKADTSGWTIQAKAVRDALPELEKRGVAVVGISPDPPEEQKAFDDKFGLGFPLLSDTDHRIGEDYGVWGKPNPDGKTVPGIVRSAFLIDKNGAVAAAWYGITPQDTVPALMKALK